MRADASDVVERLSRALGVAVWPGGLRGLLSWRPRSVAALRLVGTLVRQGRSYATVLDVGANAGQFSRAAVGFWPDAQVIAFEPLPECAQQLLRTVSPHGSVELHQVAVGSDDGSISFHPHEYSPSSSALRVASAAADEHCWAKERPSIEVPLCRLDTVLAGRVLRRPVLLKLDVQGFELEVIDGGPTTLQGVDAVLMEMALKRMYEGQPLFSEVHDRMTKGGWVLEAPIDVRRKGGSIVELDCLYTRPRTERPEGP